MDLLPIIESMPHQIRDAALLVKGKKVEGKFDRILINGMGGSGIPGDILRNLLFDSDYPIYINKDYDLPGFVDEHTLVFCISYSGNTEETIAAFKQAVKNAGKVVVITSGGKLLELARMNNVKDIVIVPSGLPPRSAVAYFVIPILVLLHNGKFIKLNGQDVLHTIEYLERQKDSIRERAADIAGKLANKIPIIYASSSMDSVALRWKQEFNENSKVHAFYNAYPEMNHNELMAYEKPSNLFHIILIEDERDNPRTKRRFIFTKDLIRSKGVEVTEIMIKGENKLLKLFTAMLMGDYCSYYLAKQYGIDAVQVDLIEQLKKKLAEK